MNLGAEDKLEALRAKIREAFPVESIMKELGSGEKPRDAVLGAAVVLAGEIAPMLLVAVGHAATGATLDEHESGLAFYSLHVLGAARDSRAFPALMRILRLPEEQLDVLLGDALTQNIARVAIGVYDGKADELYALIADNEANEYARFEMLGAMAFLAFEGRIDLENAKRFLIGFDEERLAPEQDMAWCGWENAIALLGFRDLVPRVEAAWRDGRMPEGFSEPKYFFADLRRAETEWSNAGRFNDLHRLGHIDDIAQELSWIASTDTREDEGDDEEFSFAQDRRTGQTPYINPLRRIGRNDPCPCGSGKKAKRCCLAA
jgi:hypothetical protein